MVETCAVTATQQSLISLTSLALAAGGVIAGVVGNYFGRRGTIQSGCTLIVIGAAGMLGTSGNFAAYLVCKCIGGLGLGQLYAACPIYGVSHEPHVPSSFSIDKIRLSALLLIDEAC